MNAFAALLVLAPLQGPMSFGSGGVDDFILTDKQAYMVLPPQAVGSSQTVFLDWSPSGRFLLMGQLRPQMTSALLSTAISGGRPPQPAIAVFLWDKLLNRTTELGSIPNHRSGFRWLGGRDVTLDLYIESIPNTDQERASLIRIDAPNGKLSYIPLASPIPVGVFYRLERAPLSPHAIVIETTRLPKSGGPILSSSLLWIVDEMGRSRPRTPLPQQFSGPFRWLQDGKTPVFSFYMLKEGKATEEELILDMDTAKLVPAPKVVTLYKPVPNSQSLEIVLAPMQTVTGALKRTLRAAWLKSKVPSEQAEYLLSPHADFAKVNETLDAVAILEQGVVTVRILATLPKEVFLQAKEAAEKAKALSDVKQIGTAAQIFAADNDDRFPSQEEFQNKALSPYLKNDGFFDGFTYAFGGGSIRDLKNPSGTVLGYKPVAGGFAVVFADGHAKWLNELPKNP